MQHNIWAMKRHTKVVQDALSVTSARLHTNHGPDLLSPLPHATNLLQSLSNLSLLLRKSVRINSNYPLHPPISLLVSQAQFSKLRAAQQSMMSLMLVNNQGQHCLHETRLMVTSRLGLPYHLPHGLRDLTI
jgi:hypothetical protein